MPSPDGENPADLLFLLTGGTHAPQASMVRKVLPILSEATNRGVFNNSAMGDSMTRYFCHRVLPYPENHTCERLMKKRNGPQTQEPPRARRRAFRVPAVYRKVPQLRQEQGLPEEDEGLLERQQDAGEHCRAGAAC